MVILRYPIQYFGKEADATVISRLERLLVAQPGAYYICSATALRRKAALATLWILCAQLPKSQLELSFWEALSPLISTTIRQVYGAAGVMVALQNYGEGRERKQSLSPLYYRNQITMIALRPAPAGTSQRAINASCKRHLKYTALIRRPCNERRERNYPRKRNAGYYLLPTYFRSNGLIANSTSIEKISRGSERAKFSFPFPTLNFSSSDWSSHAQ